MVLAKNRNSASTISEQIRRRIFQKQYLAVVQGKTPPNGVLIHYLSKDRDRNLVRVTDKTDRKAMKAELSYLRNKYDTGRDLSLLTIQLLTGRPHQIRVQFAEIGHPLYGDRKYGSPGQSASGPALFARSIHFRHPADGKTAEYQAEPPDTDPWKIFK